MAQSVATQLMFEGRAEEAMRLYVSLFPGSEITRIQKYGPGEPGKEGSVMRAEFTLAGHRLACIDSPIKHAFTFTPSVSLFVDCGSAEEFDRAFAELSAGGALLMPPGNYGFSTQFTPHSRKDSQGRRELLEQSHGDTTCYRATRTDRRHSATVRDDASHADC